jgi:hypothetical protein
MPGAHNEQRLTLAGVVFVIHLLWYFLDVCCWERSRPRWKWRWRSGGLLRLLLSEPLEQPLLFLMGWVHVHKFMHIR